MRRPYGYRYSHLGPLPGSPWDRPYLARRLLAVGNVLRELHARAGYPPARVLGELAGLNQTTVTNMLNGRRGASWYTLSVLGAALAVLAARSPKVVETQLRDAYLGRTTGSTRSNTRK